MEDFKFDLQRFADGGEGGTDGGTQTGADEGDETKPSEVKSAAKTPEEQEAEYQERLAAEKAKWEKEYQKKAAKAKKEAERLSKLSEDERAKEEMAATKKDLDAKEKELNRKEIKLEMVKVLSDRGIPVQFMDYLIADTSESTMERIKTFDKEFKKAVENGVNERLKGKAPKTGTTAGSGSVTTGVKNGFFEAIRKNQAKKR